MIWTNVVPLTFQVPTGVHTTCSSLCVNIHLQCVWVSSKFVVHRKVVWKFSEPTIVRQCFANACFISNVGVSKNNGTTKSSILIRFSIINHPFWGFSPYFWKQPYIPIVFLGMPWFSERNCRWATSAADALRQWNRTRFPSISCYWFLCIK